MPPGPNQLQAVGAKPSRETQGAPLYNNRFFTGLWTQRNLLRDPSGVVQERWYGGRPDALIDGANVELTNKLTLARAPGSTPYSTATLPNGATSFYSFKQFTGSMETIQLMVDAPGQIYTLNPTAKTIVVNKAYGAGTAYFIGVSNILYIGDGVEQLAWSGGAAAVRNWGIASGAGTTSAYAGAAANVASGAGFTWANPSHATGAPDGSFAVASSTSGGWTDYLQLSTYGFSISTPVVGITVTITGKGNVHPTTGGLSARLMLNGSYLGGVKTCALPTASSAVVLGGANDAWGAGLGPTDVSNSTFGVVLFGTSPVGTYSIDAVQITITGIGAPVVMLVGGGFSPAPSTGYKYVTMYGNNSEVFSPATPPSALIVPDATHSVQVSLIASADPQVNQIWVLRTLDGGTVYENIPGSPFPNTTANITDSAPDTSLNPFQQADLTGLNTPPPFGFSAFEYHLGRIWGAVGNTLYYSVGPDLGLILGNPNEGFPPLNSFVLPSAIVRLLSISTVNEAILVVFTVSDVYVIYGNGSAAAALAGVGIIAFYTAPLLRRIGLASYFGLDARGSVVYMMTNDGRVISFNPSSQIIYLDPEKSITELSFPIGAGPSPNLNVSTLAAFTPSQCYVTWHGAGSADQALYVADGSSGWFRCNPNQQPDGGMVWSPRRSIVGNCSAVQSVEVSPGVYRLLIGPPKTGGPVLYRDLTVNADNGQPYTACYLRMGAMVLAQPGQIASPDFMTCDWAPVGSPPIVGVLLNDADGTFMQLFATSNDPPHLPPPANITCSRYAFRQATVNTQPPNACRFLQLLINFGLTDVVQNEILSMTIFGRYEQES